MAVVGALAIGLVASACGSSSKSSSGTTTTAASASTTAAASSSTSASASSGGTSSGAATTTGVTSSTITIGTIADVGGPVPGLFQGAEYGIDAWAAYVNANGGIDGRKVSIDFKDSALNCTTYSNALSSLTTSTFASVGSYAIFDSCGKSVLTSHSDFPDIQGAVLNPVLIPFSNVYTAVPSPSGFATTGYQYVKDKFPNDITKTATLYGAAVTQDFEEQSNAAKSIGFKLLYSRGLGNTETNFTSDILRMKSDGVKIVDMQDCDAIEVADFLQQAQQQSFKLDALISAAAYDPGFFTDLGTADASALVAPIPVAPYLDPNSTIPNVQNFIKYLGITHPGVKPNLYALESFVSGLLFQQAMSSAGSTPSRGALLSSLSKITNFDAGGMIGPTNPGGKVPGVCYVIMGVQNGAFARIKPATGYDCTGTFVKYTAS